LIRTGRTDWPGNQTRPAWGVREGISSLRAHPPEHCVGERTTLG